MSVQHLILALIVNATWATNFIAGKFGVEHFPPMFFTAMRLALVALILVPFLRKPIHGQWRSMLLIGLFLGVLHYATMFTGLGMAGDISSVAIVSQMYVPLSTMLALFVLKESFGWRRAMGILVAFAGVLVIGFDPVVFDHLDAVGLVLMAAFFMACNQVVARRMRAVNVFTIQAWLGVISVPPLLLLSFLLEEGQWASVQSAGGMEWMALGYSAVFASLVGHGAAYYLLQRHPVNQVASLMLLTPVLAVILGVVFWGDEPTWRIVVGGAFTLGGVAFIIRRGAAKAGIEPVAATKGPKL